MFLCVSCTTAGGSVAMLPVPPVHPALEKPELMYENDRIKLADFYRRYEVYLKKLHAYKKTFR